jgi:shikimate dehydrogenase
VAHSLSPAIQNAALRSAGIPLTYEVNDVLPQDLGSVLARVVADRAAGNVTVPHKEQAHRACRSVTPIARRVGAVNTFWVDDGTLAGDNTDVAGFHNAVVALRGTEPSRARVALVGAGGAGAAVLAAVADWPASEVRVWNRTPARAIALVARFPEVGMAVASMADTVDGADLVVNATTIGLSDDAVPMDPRMLPPGADVIDLVYRPGETTWVREARAHGHRACDGLSMLIEQGALAFERWFGQPADRSAMRAAAFAR